MPGLRVSFSSLDESNQRNGRGVLNKKGIPEDKTKRLRKPEPDT